MAYSSSYSRRSRRSPLLLVVLALIVVGIGAALSQTSIPSQLSSALEQNSPQISLDLPGGFGADTQKFVVRVQDEGAGLKEVVVSAEQDGNKVELARKSLGGETSTEIPVEFNAKTSGFKDGAVLFTVSAADSSYFKNAATQTAESRVLLSRPRVETLTTQHNVAQGGVGLVVYRVISGQIKESGIRVGAREFRGYPLEAFGGSAVSGVHAALFSVPKAFDDTKERLVVFARDVADNVATAEVNHRILKKKYAEVPMKAPESFLRRKMPILLPGYSALSGKEAPSISETSTKAELVTAFRLINEDYRALLDKKLEELLSKSASRRLWQGPFVRPVAGSPTSGFGDRRVYTSDGSPAGGSTHDGVDLAAVANVEVRSAQHGTVVFADDFGIYGSTVVVDHGLGLSTLYGHLSSISVNTGDSVTPETVLGRSGATGLAGGDHLHFEIRLWNTPVSPFEWWDSKWNKDHVDDKIQSASRVQPS